MKKLYLFLLFVVASISSYAFSIEDLRFHCAEDTIKINRLLQKGVAAKLTTPNEYVSFYAQKLLGTPYVAHTLEGEKEHLTINIDELDCTTFVETLIALTKATLDNAPSWYAYAANLESIRYKNGKLDGYASRLHYISAWIVDNTARGNFHEVTSSIPRSDNQIKSIYFMTEHRDKYPQLANDSVFEEMKKVESGYSMHMSPIVKKNNLIKKDVIAALKDGDIICLTTKIEGLDVSHLGIIRFEGKEAHLLHASSTEKEVIIDKYDLYEMIRANRNWTGIRVIRVDE